MTIYFHQKKCKSMSLNTEYYKREYVKKDNQQMATRWFRAWNDHSLVFSPAWWLGDSRCKMAWKLVALYTEEYHSPLLSRGRFGSRSVRGRRDNASWSKAAQPWCYRHWYKWCRSWTLSGKGWLWVWTCKGQGVYQQRRCSSSWCHTRWKHWPHLHSPALRRHNQVQRRHRWRFIAA